MTNQQQNPDGSWGPATPLGPQGIVAKIEFWLRRHNKLPRVVDALARFDERKLGR